MSLEQYISIPRLNWRPMFLYQQLNVLESDHASTGSVIAGNLVYRELFSLLGALPQELSILAFPSCACCARMKHLYSCSAQGR